MRLFLAVLAVAFLAETAVMYLLPHLLADPHGFAAVVTDSSILATLSAPPLWWLLAAHARAEKALRRSEKHFRSLIENVSDIITVIEPDGTIAYESPSALRISGYEPGELIGMRALDLIHDDDRPSVTKAIAEAVASPGETRSVEFRFRLKDGSWRLFEAAGRAVHDAGALRVIVNSRDITERKQAEEALRDSEQRFRALLESAPIAAIVTDARGRIEVLNAAAEETFGYDRRELIGQPIDVLLPERFRERHAQECDAFLGNPARRPMAAGRDVVALRKDGSEFVATCGLAAVETGNGPLAISFVMDITERKRAEEALREAEEKWRSLVENAPDMIMTVDREGTILFMNRTVPGYAVQDAIGTTTYDYIPPEYHERIRTAVQRVFETGQPQSYEIAGDGPSGETSWYASRVGPIMRDGKVVAATIIASDITARKLAEEDVARVNSELEKEQKQIEALNRSLERKVTERTRELRIANKELQQRHRQLLTARAQAVTDALTGLPNHRAFHERVRDEVSRASANGTEIGLIMMDIDGFKSVNDSLGHLAGDRILRRLARTLCAAAPREDIYRYGGDEFTVLLPGASCRETTALAEQLRRAVEKRTNGSGEGITISLGIACYPDTASSAEELIYGSDAAMYWAKSAGKNSVGDWSKLVRHRAEGVLPWYAADRAIRASDTVSALVAALAAKDPATASHTERCSWYAARLAEELGLGERDTSIVRLASLLHDIGKLAVPDDVLFKPGPLDDHEWTLMRQHPVTALNILGQIRSVADATPAILHHHEHFDGSGYPDGLAGDRIPIASRILLVTDAFDAMTTDRPYRRAMPVEAAVEELKSNAGTQFDPDVVEAFLRILGRCGAQPLTWSEASGRARREPSASPVSAGQPSG
jgi:diguanylate cyclase (GGDEF)-like protein/PAS domain S-box-containing protein